MASDPRLALVDRLTTAFRRELGGVPLDATIPWPELPTVAALTEHVGVVHRWVSEILRTGEATDEARFAPQPGTELRGWYAEGAAHLLERLTSTPPASPCWIVGGRRGTAAFWRRRMVIENAKHLIDLRAADGAGWSPAPELSAADAADGVDELFTELLWRTRDRLPRLPGAVLLTASDTGDVWRIGADWAVSRRAVGDETATVVAPAARLALLVWERADPARFAVDGDRSAFDVFARAPIHPW